jgi:hypothetical protein
MSTTSPKSQNAAGLLPIALVAIPIMLAASPIQRAAAQSAHPGSIQGYVAAVVTPNDRAALAAGSAIYVPDIQVVARNLDPNVHFASAPAVTNAQGYFRTPVVQPGQYQICVSGHGFTAKCFGKVEVSRPLVTLGEFVPIRPEGAAIFGTAMLSDHRTPCFFFRPSFSPLALTAKASLLTADNKLVAASVKGNSSGQYVLPVPGNVAGTKLHVECDSSTTETSVTVKKQFTEQNVTIAASVPRIVGFDFSKGNVGIRRADRDESITVSVLAQDPDGHPLHYSWADDSGRTLALPDAPTVEWRLLDANALNTLHVYVSNTKGGIATYARSLQSGPDELFFSGRVFNRQTKAGVASATVRLNGISATADAQGNFRVVVKDARKFVLNVTHPGYALASQVLTNRVVGIQVPLDPVHIATVNGGSGGIIRIQPGSGCNCQCSENSDTDKAGGADRCVPPKGATLAVGFQADSFVGTGGAPYTGNVSVEALQYDLTKTNPIPGDFGAVYQGKQVRLGTFGAFNLLPRDAQGQPLTMAPGKHASVSLPIQPGQRAAAPATIPLFHYDEETGLWIEDGTLTRSGDAYEGLVTHFSVFNADTVFPGGACVKVLLSGFAMPVTLDASYYDPSVGNFNHPGFSTTDTTVGVERMTPNQNFTLTVTDSASPNPAVVQVPLFSGPGLDPVQFPGGYDSDTVNFSHCNGPVQVANNQLPPVPPYFLGPVFGGTIVDNSAKYQAATDAQSGGSRDTLDHWKGANGFNSNGTPASGEASALYFNNGDLKFGRDMHCRVTNNTPGAIACYVSNFGAVGTDDAPFALSQAEAYEASHQVSPQPAATVAMEYDPTAGSGAVQFWAYKGDGSYLALPILDSEGAKPMPDMCLACHQGTYSGTPGTKVNGASFLAFDLDSFLDDTGTPFPSSVKVTAAVQQQFHLLNNMVAATNPPPGVDQLQQLWYTSTTSTVPFAFNQGAAQLPGQPFVEQPGSIHHEPLYDSVVKVVCRTCHVALPGREWNSFSQMYGSGGSEAAFIQSLVCAPTLIMPHAEVPWQRFWQQNMAATLASELAFPPPGCPPS